jgi:hypothetical protein
MTTYLITFECDRCGDRVVMGHAGTPGNALRLEGRCGRSSPELESCSGTVRVVTVQTVEPDGS